MGKEPTMVRRGQDGAERAGRIANRTLQKVMKKIGYVLPVR